MLAALLAAGLSWRQSRLPADCFWLSRAACLARLGAGMDKQISEVWSSGQRHGSAQLLLARDGRYQIYSLRDDVDGGIDVAEAGRWQEVNAELTLRPLLGGAGAARCASAVPPGALLSGSIPPSDGHGAPNAGLG
ncbi:hypothetical protein [Chromobacterium subtsugae]|uniref:hypothetical protein n=1 Tax=Chromobacterium subtsugae TaxID=251747 RepID=UPI0007F878D1|nr:hypothetical protein [Chromobacterium subtsugae]OBU86330.1 hypothetical protein MY55_11795 [Chromobacterium subtsugae]